MEVREAVKILRRELGITQKELASALGLSFSTVNRWENGRATPDSSAMRAIAALAKEKQASALCRKYLRETLTEGRKETLKLPSSGLYSVERESICSLVDESNNAVYVADMETDELLYANRKAEEFFKRTFKADSGQKCYEFFAASTKPCEFCPKVQMSQKGFSDSYVYSRSGDRRFHVHGKKLDWNGRSAHVQYFTDETNAIEAQNGLKKLLDTAEIGICTGCIYDDGRIELTFLNDGYYRMIGAASEERRSHANFFAMSGIYEPDRQAAAEKVYSAVHSQNNFNVTFRIILPDGVPKWLNVRGQFTEKTDSGSLYTCVIIDVDQFIK